MIRAFQRSFLEEVSSMANPSRGGDAKPSVSESGIWDSEVAGIVRSDVVIPPLFPGADRRRAKAHIQWGPDV